MAPAIVYNYLGTIHRHIVMACHNPHRKIFGYIDIDVCGVLVDYSNTFHTGCDVTHRHCGTRCMAAEAENATAVGTFLYPLHALCERKTAVRNSLTIY